MVSFDPASFEQFEPLVPMEQAGPEPGCFEVRFDLDQAAAGVLLDGGVRQLETQDHAAVPGLALWNSGRTEQFTTETRRHGADAQPCRILTMDQQSATTNDLFRASLRAGLTVPECETPRSQVTHLYRRDRAGQHHGVPWLTPSLPLCNLLRQWTMATVTAARTAAKHSAVLESNANSVTSDGTSLQPLNPFDAEEIDYDMLTALPMGWRLAQMKAEQPTTGYEMFRDCLLGEIVRPLGAPLNVVLGSSAKWNYASTQADRITFAGRVSILRHEIEIEELDRTFAAWWDEASLMPGLIPDGIGPLQSIPHRWFWDSLPDADPQTLAQAREIDIRTGHASREQLLHESGQDIDSHDETAAKSFGLTVDQFRQLLARKTFGSTEVDQVLASTNNGSTPVAMNGAQLQALSLVVAQVSQGQMRPDAARAMAAAAFPSLQQDQIAAMFPDAGDRTAPASVATADGSRDQVLVESN